MSFNIVLTIVSSCSSLAFPCIPETRTDDLLLYSSRLSSACSSWSIRLSFSTIVFSSRSSRSLILLATISAILLARDSMTSSSFNACFAYCMISPSATNFLRPDGIAEDFYCVTGPTRTSLLKHTSRSNSSLMSLGNNVVFW